ncbi:MAG: hypothetical protein WC584_04530 [Candidatus Pacearchaeota archaeon]
MINLIDIAETIQLNGGLISVGSRYEKRQYASSPQDNRYECRDDCDCVDCPSDCICMDCQDCND